MSMGGSKAPCAFIRLLSYGKLDRDANKIYADELSKMVDKTFGITSERCFIEFKPIEAHMIARSGITLEEALEKTP